MRWSLLLAKDLGFQVIELQTDCLQLFQAWSRQTPFNNYLATIVQDCKLLYVQFRKCTVTNCRRIVNDVADFIAHMAFDYQDHVWVELILQVHRC